MARLRKNVAYQSLERPYTRVSKFNKQNYVRGGKPALKITKFDMGSPNKIFDTTLRLLCGRDMNIRHNALESARMSSNRLLEMSIGKEYFLRVKVYPFHILREHSLASGAGADRMSSGMARPFGKAIGAAARVKEGQTLMELKINKKDLKLAREALSKASKKFPCTCKIVAA